MEFIDMEFPILLLVLEYVFDAVAADFTPNLETVLPVGAYVIIALAVILGLLMIAGLVFTVVRERRQKAQVMGIPPKPSGSTEKPTSLGRAFSKASMNEKDDSVKMENETHQTNRSIETFSTNFTKTEDLLNSREGVESCSSFPPKQTIQRSFSRTVVSIPDVSEKSRQSVMSNASVITRQASSSSIMVRTSPDDAKRPESIRPESTMVTLEEQPETVVDVNEGDKCLPSGNGNDKKTVAQLKRTLSKSTISPALPNNKPLKRQLSKTVMSVKGQRPEYTGTIESVVEKPEDPETGNSTFKTEKGKPTAPLKRTMSKASIAPAFERKPLNRQMSKNNMTPSVPTKPMNRQLSRTMSRATLKLGEHVTPSAKTSIQEEGHTVLEESDKLKDQDQPPVKQYMDAKDQDGIQEIDRKDNTCVHIPLKDNSKEIIEKELVEDHGGISQVDDKHLDNKTERTGEIRYVGGINDIETRDEIRAVVEPTEEEGKDELRQDDETVEHCIEQTELTQPKTFEEGNETIA